MPYLIKRCSVHCLCLGLLISACRAQAGQQVDGLSGYPISPVDIRNVRISDEFWLPIIKRVQDKTIGYALQKCHEEGRLENFLIAGGQMDGDVRGLMPFDDTDVYKTIEGVSNSLISAPNAELESLLDSLIAIIGEGQEEDGYLTTWRTIDPAAPPAPWVKVNEGKRWESLEASHELYNAGHLYEAAAVHYLATGKKNFLDIATRNADLMVRTFGPGKIETVPGHQIIETGLIKLYRITGKQEYLDLAKYLLDGRGDTTAGRQLFGPYSQDHKPVTQQAEVVGHAVRAVYMYAGMTDIAAIYGDRDYEAAIEKLWDNMVSKKMYITGGIGARHEGESFGDNYELPNLTAYNETCASIGSVYWNHRLFMLKGNVKYFDVIERTLYNGLISGLSLDGVKFFYPNALESDGKYAFNQGECTRQSWFDCSCCPTNIIRFIPSVPGLIYARQKDTLYVNLYTSSEATVDLNGREVFIKQQTEYPWNGRVEVQIKSATEKPFVVKLRIPGWSRDEVLPGDLYTYSNPCYEKPTITFGGGLRARMHDGYFVLEGSWSGETSISLNFPMQVREVGAYRLVEENRNKKALEYGPIVYAFEEIDNQGTFDTIGLTGNEEYTVSMNPSLLGGVNVLEVRNEKGTFKAVPYFSWSNRGVGKMKVWISETN